MSEQAERLLENIRLLRASANELLRNHPRYIHFNQPKFFVSPNFMGINHTPALA